MTDAIFFLFWETRELESILSEMNDRQALYSENNSGPQTGIEPAPSDDRCNISKLSRFSKQNKIASIIINI